MPLSRLIAQGIQLIKVRGAADPGVSLPVKKQVITGRHAVQILDPVIALVFVFVVDVPSVRDLSALLLPYLSVQAERFAICKFMEEVPPMIRVVPSVAEQHARALVSLVLANIASWNALPR